MLDEEEERRKKKKDEEEEQNQNFAFNFLDCEEKSWDSGAIFDLRYN